MATSRRTFLTSSALAALGLNLRCATAGDGGRVASNPPEPLPQNSGLSPPAKAAKPLRILILGGTGFIGPHEVHYALARGHRLTLFNRGKTNPTLFPDVEKLQGDRAVGNAEGAHPSIRVYFHHFCLRQE